MLTDVEGVNNFPDDFDEMLGVRNESARARRRTKDYSPRVSFYIKFRERVNRYDLL